MIMKLCMEQYVLKLYKVYINDDPALNLTHFKTMSKLLKLVFAQISGERLQDHWSSGENLHSENISALVRCEPIRKLYEAQKEGV